MSFDYKWVVGFIISVLGLQAGIFFRVVALHERLATIEAKINHIEATDRTNETIPSRLAVIESKLNSIEEELRRR